MWPLDYFYYFELLALISAIVFLPGAKDKTLRWFMAYLAFILCAELFARYIRKVNHEPNVWLFDLTIPVEYFMYSYVLCTRIKPAGLRKGLSWLAGLCIAFFIMNTAFIQGLGIYDTHNALVGTLLMILLSTVVLIEEYRSEMKTPIWQSPYFWIASGVLLFNTGEFAYNLFSSYLINEGFDKAALIFGKINHTILIPLLYTCLSIGFLCTRIQRTSRED